MIAILLVFGFAVFQTAPLWFNRNERLAGVSQNKCKKHITDPAHDPRRIPRPDDSIKIINLTNSGEFADRCELTNALYELNWDRPRLPGTYGATIKPSAEHKPKLVVMYIHGWKHNADDSDTDRINFGDLIQMLRARNPKNRVVGIYVGWNAEAGLGRWLDNLTFWVKKNNADRIAQSSSVTLIVSSIGAIVHNDPGRDDQFIAIGHSFGARILFSATEQSLVSATEAAHPGFPGGTYSIVNGLADAVILLNPAFEASRYSAINDFARNNEAFSEYQNPLIVTISSEQDSATKEAFPLGQWFGLARTDRELRTLGNYDPFQTHTLARSKPEDCFEEGSAGMLESYFADGLYLRRLEEPVYNAEVDNIGVIQPFNPFVVARTTGDIIHDYNDIWNDTFRTWLADLINLLHSRRSELSSGGAR